MAPEDYELLGFYWEGKYYFDKCMPMGCRTSCKIFEECSTVIEWIAQNKLGIAHVVYTLDDFLFIENSKESALSKFKKVFGCLCIYRNYVSSRQNSTANTGY